MGKIVETSIGRVRVDGGGVPVSIIRVNPARAYGAIPLLLQKVINQRDNAAWEEIASRIDFIYEKLDYLFDPLSCENEFHREITKRVSGGQKLFFKPNLVTPVNIDPVSHGPVGVAVTTPWPTIAALMRWFHDKLGITYHQMSLGEAPTSLSVTSGRFSILAGRTITTQAVIEGKDGDFYGGWGFYFVRRYLHERHSSNHKDNPMNGYEESLAGRCIPPGEAPDKLLVYDINKVDDKRTNGRDVKVPHGVNFKEITLHKAVVGGDPLDSRDRARWPGCVLINVPRLKVHVTELITGAVKNLGIGLYPMEVNSNQESGEIKWKYALPHKPLPGMKTLLPHRIWFFESDDDTAMPKRNAKGEIILRKTGGMQATVSDVIEAVTTQGIYMLHIVDAIEATNGLQAGPAAYGLPEGLVFASHDPLALDVAAARYLFTTVPLADARLLQSQTGLNTDFLQKIPLPVSDGQNMVTHDGYDSPIERYKLFRYCQKRGIGRMFYHVVGKDLWEGGDLLSVRGHLGRVQDGNFMEILTTSLYYSVGKPLYDLQATTLSYAAANDKLTGSNFKEAVLTELDENGDGIIDYNEKGKGGYNNFMDHAPRLFAFAIPAPELLRVRFLMGVIPLRTINSAWKSNDIVLGPSADMSSAVLMGMRLSTGPDEQTDPFFPNITYGNGKWPSVQFMRWLAIMQRIYGPMFPSQFDNLNVPYGLAVIYAAMKHPIQSFKGTNGNLVGEYHQHLKGGLEPLPFTFYVPTGMGQNQRLPIPNVTETADSNLVFTASFEGGKEIWRDLSLAKLP